MFAQTKAIVLRRFFKSDRQRGVSAKMPFSFCKAFSLGLFPQKKKRYNSFATKSPLVAFLYQNRHKEKLSQEMPSRLRGGRHL